MGYNSRPDPGIAAQIFIVVPEHVRDTDRQALVVFINQLVVVTGHPADAPVILYIFPGQRFRIQA